MGKWIGGEPLSIETLSPEVGDRVERTFAALRKRGFEPSFAGDRAAALAAVLAMLPTGAAVAHGSSVSLQEIGLVDHLKRPDSGYRYINTEVMAENDPARRMRLRARLLPEVDYFLGSLQAICQTGEAIASDGSGSRVSAYAFGPPHVIWVAGINKLVPTVEDGIRRVREVALPLEDRRMKDLGAPGSMIGKLVVFERERPGRISLVLVGEPLGY